MAAKPKRKLTRAEKKEIAAIILVKGRTPEKDTAAESDAEGIPILSTSLETFEITGELYKTIKG